MAKTLRTLVDADFTTKGNTLTFEEVDQNFIDIWNATLDGKGVTATAAELNTLDGFTGSTANLNNIDGLTVDLSTLTATASELNRLDGNLTTVRQKLGLEIGVDVQGHSDILDDISLFSADDGNFIVGNGTTFVEESGNTARTSLGLGTGDSPTFAGTTITQSSDTDLLVSSINSTATIEARGPIPRFLLTDTSSGASDFEMVMNGSELNLNIDSTLALRLTSGTTTQLRIDNTSGTSELLLRAPIPTISLTDTSGGALDGSIIMNSNTLSLSVDSTEIIGITSSNVDFSQSISVQDDITSGNLIWDYSEDTLDVPNLYVSEGLFAKEFTVDTTRVMLTRRMGVGGGVIGEVVDSTVGSEVVKFVDEDGNFITPVADNDLILIQQRSGVNSGTIIKSIKRKVVADSQPSNEVSLTTSGVTTGTDTGTIAVGDNAVVDGNTTNTNRDGLIDVNVTDLPIPAFQFRDGRTDFNVSAEVMRVGGLDPAGSDEFSSALSGDIGIAGKVSGNLAFAVTDSEGFIGGFDFDDGSLWTDDGSGTAGTFTGLQGGTGVRQFFSGADDNTGTNADFYVQDGRVYSEAFGGIIDAKSIEATNAEDDDVLTDNLYDVIWHTAIQSIDPSTTDSEVDVKKKIQYRKKQNIDEVRITAYIRREISGSALTTSEAFLECNIGGELGTNSTTNSTFTEISTTVDISSLTDGNIYELQVRLLAQVVTGSSTSAGNQANCDAYMRNDLIIEEGIIA